MPQTKLKVQMIVSKLARDTTRNRDRDSVSDAIFETL